MGTVFEKFGSNKYDNEAAVNQNFVLPLLTDLLGYSRNEVIPEKNYPAFDIPLNRRKKIRSDKLPEKQKPDFVICLENLQKPKFVLESKASKEDLKKHKPQSVSYVIGVKVNIIVVTNGIELQIFDVNNLIFEAKSIEELDLKFDILKQILSRDSQVSYTPMEIIQRIDLEQSLSKTTEQEIDEEIARKRLKISDFIFYLKNACDEFKNWQVPREFKLGDDFDFQQYPPDKLLKFQDYDPNDNSFSNLTDRKIYSLLDVEKQVNSKNIIFIGHSGIGKTTLLKYLTWVMSNECLQYQKCSIPIYIQLRNYGLNNSIENLILDSLAKRDLNISEVQFRDYLKKNEFVFLFDAYDEVKEEYLEDLRSEMEQFIDIFNHKNHRVIVTSRNIRIPRILYSSQFYVCPLDESQIQELSKQYFDSDFSKFYYEIQIKGLRTESQNTLLLTLMIFIYKKSGLIPNSKTKIIEKVVNNIKDWEEIKPKRSNFVLSWKIKTDLLSELAFTSAKEHESLSLAKEEADKIMFPIIEHYERSRDIPSGIERQSLINNLISTGIIYEKVDGISFWHTAFLEYFASISLAKKYTENVSIIEEIKPRPWWNFIIIGAAGFLNDSTAYVESILKTNLYLASSCLIESEYVDNDLVNKVRSQLILNCESSIFEVRQRGIYFLSKIDEKYPSELLFELFEKSSYTDVKQIALEKIATNKSERAKNIVYSLIDWKEELTFLEITTTQGSVAKALSNFGENEHLIIIDIWKKNTDTFTCSACREAFVDIVRKNQLTEVVKEKLYNFYLEPIDQNSLVDDKKDDLAKVIIEINDAKFIPKSK